MDQEAWLTKRYQHVETCCGPQALSLFLSPSGKGALEQLPGPLIAETCSKAARPRPVPLPPTPRRPQLVRGPRSTWKLLRLPLYLSEATDSHAQPMQGIGCLQRLACTILQVGVIFTIARKVSRLERLEN